MIALEVKNLTKKFDKITAVDNASFSVPEGSVFGLIGRNGAGKTTTIRMMMNIYEPDGGEVLLRGNKVDDNIKSKIGYLPEERGLYKKMKVTDTLHFFAEVKGKSGRELNKKLNEYLKQFQLYERRNDKIEDLSKGNQQKIQFIATILHSPEFIILDEPFSGLDPINTNLLKNIILQMKDEGKVIIISTHLMEYAEKMCDHLAMIDKGKIILNGSMSEIKNQFSQNNISLAYSGDISFLKEERMIEKIEDFGNSTGIRLKHGFGSQQLLSKLIEKNVEIKRFDVNEISLHEIFVSLAGKDNSEVTNV